MSWVAKYEMYVLTLVRAILILMSSEGPITYFAQTDARAKRVSFGIKSRDRSRHMYVIGKTGMGKSTLLENMAVQDIQNGNGFAFIDPHGASAEKLLDYIPEDRVKDVLYFAPFDLQYPISFNVLENVEVDHRHLVVNGLMSTFEKLWEDQWSARMAYILQNTLAALLEFPGATLLGVNRMYVDKDFRKRVVDNCSDPTVKSFWTEEYAKYTDRYTQEATPAIQNKIGQFQANSLVRNIIGQSESTFNLREMMDTRKIFIVNLSKGRVGEGNASLLGSMLVTKLYLAAMSRADVPATQLAHLPEFELYVDEFQNFANRSFSDILSESRKYKLALTIAHQYIEQMEEEVAAAVFGNVGTMVVFRVGAYDAEVLEKEFMPTFTGEDLVNLGARQIYLKLMIDGVSSQPFSATTLPPIDMPRVSLRDKVVAFSRARYSRPRAEVERDIREWTLQSFAPSPEERTKAGGEKKSTYTKESKKETSSTRIEKSGVGEMNGARSVERAPRPQGSAERQSKMTPAARPPSAPASTREARAPASTPKEDFETYTERTYREAYALPENSYIYPNTEKEPPSFPAPMQSTSNKKEELQGEDLRTILKRLSQEAAQKEAEKNTSQEQPVASVSQPKNEPTKEDLRAVLARIVAESSKREEEKKSKKVSQASTPAQSGTPVTEKTEKGSQSQSASTPPALSPEELRRMLALKKPKL